LGFLPLGTANDFAGTLRLPTDLERACETGAQGEVVDVDFGLSGENYYANVASVGLGAEVNQSLYSPECVERLYEKWSSDGISLL
jgi:diacylglycerol kinase (ATP)